MTYKKNKKSRIRKIDRLFHLEVIFFILGFAIILRLFNLQVLSHAFYGALASGQHDIYLDLLPKRGEIFIKDIQHKEKLFPMAVNQKLSLVYAEPNKIKEPEKIAQALSPLLDEEEEELKAKLLKKNDPYEPLKHFLDDKKVEEIKALNLEGIGFMPEIQRFYPEGNIFSHLVGFLGYEGKIRKGQYGIEGYFEEELAGKQGRLESEQDPTGRLITIGKRKIIKAQDGSDIILTLDHTIQFKACRVLEEAIQKYKAVKGTVIVMDPQTGAIRALCNFPNFDPNEYSRVEDINVFINPAISSSFEPGSIFKAITFAAGLNSGKISPDETYEDLGFVKIGEHIIKNAGEKKYGKQTMTQVLEKSINTGAIFVIKKIGPDIFREYVEDFGFGNLTGIELPAEVPGDISSLSKKGDIWSATASFGQGISVTPLQMVSAFATIANDGELMKPYLVDEIKKSDGEAVKTEPKMVRQVISFSAATYLKAMLVSSVKNGHGKKAQVKGYYIAGKTGTAQIPYKDKPGYSNETIHSFAGFAPVDDPKFVILVKLERPTRGRYAESTAAPTFAKLAEFLLQYYQVPPEY